METTIVYWGLYSYIGGIAGDWGGGRWGGASKFEGGGLDGGCEGPNALRLDQPRRITIIRVLLVVPEFQFPKIGVGCGM